MSNIYIFRRIEKKYRITTDEAEILKKTLADVLIPDEHGKSTIGNLYLDTPDFLLIRNSIDALSYKEKLRIRSYGMPKDDTTIFLELKKKYNGVVFKRRISLPLYKASGYLEKRIPPTDSQIMKEIDYAMRIYRYPQPHTALFYEREAYTWRDEDSVRLTFDTGVRYRTNDLLLQNGMHGITILPVDTVLLEIKCSGAMPLRLSHTLDSAHIFPTRFSKYGTAYLDILRKQETQNDMAFINNLSSFVSH